MTSVKLHVDDGISCVLSC